MRVVNVEVSGGVPAPVNTVWTLLTAFSDTIDYRFTRNDVEKILHGQVLAFVCFQTGPVQWIDF